MSPLIQSDSPLQVKKGYHSLARRTGAILFAFLGERSRKAWSARHALLGNARKKISAPSRRACLALLALFALSFAQLKNVQKITPVQLSNHSPVTIILYCLSLMKNHNCTRVFNTCKTFKQTNVYKFIDQHYHNLSL